MIISNNREPNLQEFQNLLDLTTLKLNDDATGRNEYYLKRNAQLLEDDVFGFLNVAAVGTQFEGTIKKISGQRFPDIVAAKYYGVEVKSSKDEKWVSLGGSVNESTRVANVERIFITFGKLASPVEFRSKPYEDCLSEVVVTHYPRYKVDMNLADNSTIFSKMNTTYDTLRLSENPVGTIVDYYKRQLNDGESLWWTGSPKQEETVESVPMKIRLMRTLTAREKHSLRIAGFAYFPDMLSDSSTKYERFSLWLASRHGVVSTSTRDLFSAGGQKTISTGDNVSRKIYYIYENRDAISKCINESDEHVLMESWKVNSIKKDRVGQWLDVASSYCHLKDTHVLCAIFDRS